MPILANETFEAMPCLGFCTISRNENADFSGDHLVQIEMFALFLQPLQKKKSIISGTCES